MKWQIVLISFVFTVLSQAQKPIEPLLDSIQAYMKREHIPGAMIAITTIDSVIYSSGIGLARVGRKEEVTADHLFRIGSISKGFTALGLLKLEAERKLSLSDPIGKLDPQIPKDKWPVTVENLLEHTAGYDDMHFKAMYNRKDKAEPTTSALIKIHDTALRSRWKPGTRMSYSNPGYVMAGHIIEKVSGIPYAEYLKTNVINPIGMASSGFFFKEPDSPLMAQGYTRKDGANIKQPYVSIQGGPAGSMIASANDMAKFLTFTLQKGDQVIPVEKFDRWEKAETTLAAKKGLAGGYGLGNGNSWRKGYLFHGHSGGIDGFSSDYVYSRSANIGVAVAMNTMGNPGKITEMILDYFVENLPSKKRKEVKIPIELSKKFAGFYEGKSPRNQLMGKFEAMWSGLSVSFEKDFAITQDLLGEWTDTLYYAGNNQFYAGNSGIPNTFIDEIDGKKVLWMWNTYYEKGSKSKRFLKIGAFILSIGFSMLFLIYGMVWLPLSYFKKWKINRSPRWVLWFACVSLFAAFSFFVYSASGLYENGLFHFASVMIFISSIIFFIMAALGLRHALLLRTESMLFRVFFLVTALSLAYLAFFFLVNGFVGFKFWSY